MQGKRWGGRRGGNGVGEGSRTLVSWTTTSGSAIELRPPESRLQPPRSVVPPDRFERPARGVEIRCSVQLSYGGRLSAWRRDPESNRALRVCKPPHGRFATAPKIGNRCGHLSLSSNLPTGKAEVKPKAKQWSRPPELNRPAQLGRLAPNRSARPALKMLVDRLRFERSIP